MTLCPIWVIMVLWIEDIHPGQPGQTTAKRAGAIAYERTPRNFPQCGDTLQGAESGSYSLKFNCFLGKKWRKVGVVGATFLECM